MTENIGGAIFGIFAICVGLVVLSVVVADLNNSAVYNNLNSQQQNVVNQAESNSQTALSLADLGDGIEIALIIIAPLVALVIFLSRRT